MAISDYNSVVQQLYVAYFGRPADPVGLLNFTTSLNNIGAPTTISGLTAAYSTNATIKSLIDSFGTSTESANLYTGSTAAFVNAIFQNVLGRSPALEGLLFWSNAIDSGSLTRGNAAAAIMAGAQANTTAQGVIDAAVVANKVTVAANFTTALDSAAEVVAYSGSTAAATARAMLAQVTNTTDTTAFQSTVTSTVSNVVTGGNVGSSLTLTTGVDQGAAFTGGSGDDTFTASYNLTSKINTLSGLDKLDGGAGTDTLTITNDTGNYTIATGITLSNIENITIAGAGNVTADITPSTITGVTSLSTTQGADIALTAGKTTNITVSGATGAIATDGGLNISVTDATADKSIKIGDTTVNAGTITVTDSKVGAGDIKVDGGTNVTINATGSVNGGANVITVGNGGVTTDLPSGTVSVTSAHTGVAATDVALHAITVKGGSTVTITQTSDTSKAASDTTGATLTQGAVTVVGGGATTSVTVTQAASKAEVVGVTAVAGVTETASVKFSALTTGQTLVMGGLTFTAAADMTAAEVAAAFANLTKGFVPTVGLTSGDTQGAGAASKGTYTGYLNGWTSGAVSTDTVVFTSTTANTNVADLANTGTGTATITTTAGSAATAAKTGVLGVITGTVTIDDNATASITTVSVDGYGNGSTIGNTTTLSKLSNLTLANSGGVAAGDTNGTMTVDAAGVASLNVTVNNIKGNVSLDGAADNALKTVNLTASGANSSFALTAAAAETLTISGDKSLTLSSGTFTALKSITVSGSAGATFDGDEADTLTSVNTSATTGAVTSTIDGTKATYTGGAGVDTVTLATGTALTKAIDLGAGDDTLSFAALNVTGSTASVAGGDGNDTLSMAAATAANLDNTKQSFYSSFEYLTINDAGAGQTIALDNLGFTSRVTTNGGTITLDKLASNGTVVLNAATTATTVQIADASKGTADVLNVVTNVVSADVNFGTLTAADVETININADDTKLDDNSDGVNDAVETATLALVATKATKIAVTGDSNLTLTTTGNTKVTEIDGSAMTGVLTVQAAGITASTIKGGSGADVLTASGGATGSTAQVTAVVLTDGTATAGLDDNDTMAITVGSSTFTYTAAGVETMDTAGAALAALIDADAAYTAAYNAGTNTITVTAAVAGTPFTVSAYTVTDVANDVNKTATAAVITEAQATVQEKHTIAITVDGADNNDETVTVTYDNDGSAGAGTGTVAGIALTDPTNKTTTANEIVAALNADNGFKALAVAANVGDDVVVTFKGNDTYATNTTIAVAAGTTNTLGFATTDTANGTLEQTTLVYTGTATGTLTKGDTLAVTIDYDGAGAAAAETITYTVLADAGETLDFAASALKDLIHAKAGVDATINTGTDTITITDAISADANGITVTAFTVTDVAETTNATGATAAATTTTANVTPMGDTLIGNGGNDTLTSGAALGTMTGGSGQDLFVVGAASTNVNAYTTITDFTSDDMIKFAGAVGFKSAAVTLGGTAVFQDFANAAINAIQADQVGWFNFGGDTYLVMDAGADGTTFANGTDFIVKLTGTIDLTNASFNNTYDTIAL